MDITAMVKRKMFKTVNIKHKNVQWIFSMGETPLKINKEK
jgi:hypothetical protein